MRIKIVLAYDGTDYHGWQLQKNGPTIQGFVENALCRICSMPVRVHGSGRTDAGVHALGQTAHFDAPAHTKAVPWQKALNAVLPESIRIVRCKPLDSSFHARFSAVSKTYSYTLWTESDFVLPQRRRYVWKTGPLNAQAMKAASRSLLGLQDFSVFMNQGTDVKSTWREIRDISFCAGTCPQELMIKITANGFLKQMVRNIAGTLVVTGRNSYSTKFIKKLLLSGDRSLAPATAPASGLCLESVEYSQEYS